MRQVRSDCFLSLHNCRYRFIVEVYRELSIFIDRMPKILRYFCCFYCDVWNLIDQLTTFREFRISFQVLPSLNTNVSDFVLLRALCNDIHIPQGTYAVRLFPTNKQYNIVLCVKYYIVPHDWWSFKMYRIPLPNYSGLFSTQAPGISTTRIQIVIQTYKQTLDLQCSYVVHIQTMDSD